MCPSVGLEKEGPYADQRVYDPVIQALSGATDIQADRLTGKPTMFRVIIADKVASLTASQAISSALYHRERTGEGQDIKLSMLDAMLSFFWPEAMAGLTYADDEWDPSSKGAAMDLVFEASDGYITAGAISDKEWVGMCRSLNREDLIDDERFATARGRGLNGDERKRITGEEIAKWPREEILARMRENGVPSAPLLKRSELLDNDQIQAGGSVFGASTQHLAKCVRQRQRQGLARVRVKSRGRRHAWVSIRSTYCKHWATQKKNAVN